MGLAFDLAEGINLLVGTTLSEGPVLIRERLESRAFRRRLANSFLDEMRGLGLLEDAEIDHLLVFLGSPAFYATVVDGTLADSAVEATLERILQRLAPAQRTLVLHRCRQIVVKTVLQSADPVDQLSLHMLQNLDETALFLTNLGVDSFTRLDEISEQIDALDRRLSVLPSVEPAAAGQQVSAARSLLALTVEAVVRDLTPGSLENANNRSLLRATATALDMLIDDFECTIEQLLIVLHHVGYSDLYGSAGRIRRVDLARANRRLEALTEDANAIAESIPALSEIPISLNRLAAMTASVVVVEDFLVVRMGHVNGGQAVDDNLDSPRFPREAGDETLREMSNALSRLSWLRMQVRREFAGVLAVL